MDVYSHEGDRTLSDVPTFQREKGRYALHIAGRMIRPLHPRYCQHCMRDTPYRGDPVNWDGSVWRSGGGNFARQATSTSTTHDVVSQPRAFVALWVTTRWGYEGMSPAVTGLAGESPSPHMKGGTSCTDRKQKRKYFGHKQYRKAFQATEGQGKSESAMGDTNTHRHAHTFTS